MPEIDTLKTRANFLLAAIGRDDLEARIERENHSKGNLYTFCSVHGKYSGVRWVSFTFDADDECLDQIANYFGTRNHNHGLKTDPAADRRGESTATMAGNREETSDEQSLRVLSSPGYGIPQHGPG